MSQDDSIGQIYNFKKDKFELINHDMIEEHAKDYIPTNQIAFNLYDLYVENGMPKVKALLKILSIMTKQKM